MFRPSIMLLATMLCVSCVSHRPIQDSSSPPIDAANPLDGTPVALAWSSGTQLMMGVDTGAVQTSLLFSPAVESIGARLRGRGAMRKWGRSFSEMTGGLFGKRPPKGE